MQTKRTSDQEELLDSILTQLQEVERNSARRNKNITVSRLEEKKDKSTSSYRSREKSERIIKPNKGAVLRFGDLIPDSVRDECDQQKTSMFARLNQLGIATSQRSLKQTQTKTEPNDGEAASAKALSVTFRDEVSAEPIESSECNASIEEPPMQESSTEILIRQIDAPRKTWFGQTHQSELKPMEAIQVPRKTWFGIQMSKPPAVEKKEPKKEPRMSSTQINKSLLSLYQNCLDAQEDNADTSNELSLLGKMLK